MRAVALAVAVGLGVGLYVQLWLRWPTFLAVAAGALMAIVLLMIAASLDDDPAKADAAWREAAPDLVGRRADADPPNRRTDSPSARDRP